MNIDPIRKAEAENLNERLRESLRETELRLQQILDNSSAIVYVKDTQGRYLLANREFERLLGTTAEQILGRTDREVFDADIATLLQRNDRRIIEERRSLEFEESVVFLGEQRIYLSQKFPLLRQDGEVYAVCGISTDITGRKRNEIALREAALAVSGTGGSAGSTEIFEGLALDLARILKLEVAFFAIHADTNTSTDCTVGSASTHPAHVLMRTLSAVVDGRVVPNFEYPLAGSPCENVVGKTFVFIPSAVRRRFEGDNMLAEVGAEGYIGYPLNDTQGRPLGLAGAMSRAPLEDADLAEAMLKIFATRAAAEIERRRAAEALRSSEASYRAIFEASEDAIFVHDYDSGAIVDVNPKACATYGYTRAEMLRLRLADISSGQPPYTEEHGLAHIERAKQGNPQRFEWHRRNKDGSLHWDEVVLRQATIDGRLRILAFTREITERKLAEERLRQAQKMEAVGQLAGGIAHDFNNILTSVMGYITLALERPTLAQDSKAIQYLEQAQDSGRRARDLIRQMLAFSRGQRGTPQPMKLDSLIDNTVRLLRPTLPATMEIRIEQDGTASSDIPTVLLDPVQAEQILVNLCINARDAMQGRGALTIGFGRTATADSDCASCRQALHGSHAFLRVSDTGAGIDTSIRNRIFDPFFSTKETGQGTGMGLATVHGLVHEHGGHVLLDSETGRGTSFTVLLPEVDNGIEQDRIAPREPAPVRTSGLRGHLLVVDDELAVASFMREWLQNHGLTVTLAHSGAEALELFRADPGRYDFVITDQTMPRMTGIELIAHLRQARPGLPIVLYTGYSDGLTSDESRRAGAIALLRKPVDTAELIAVLRQYLD